jgi:hypothetical protein
LNAQQCDTGLAVQGLAQVLPKTFSIEKIQVIIKHQKDGDAHGILPIVG